MTSDTTLIKVKKETKELIDKIKGWRMYKKARRMTYNDILTELSQEELKRIKKERNE